MTQKEQVKVKLKVKLKVKEEQAKPKMIARQEASKKVRKIRVIKFLPNCIHQVTIHL